MKLIDIEPRLEKNEGVTKEAHERIDLMLEREKQIVARLEALETKYAALAHSHATHTHDGENLLQVAAEAAEEVTETVQEAVEEVADVVEETAEEVAGAFTAFGRQVKEGSDGGDATFPEKTEAEAEEKVKVEPPAVDTARVVNDYVEVINKETGKTHRIHRNLLARIVGSE